MDAERARVPNISRETNRLETFFPRPNMENQKPEKKNHEALNQNMIKIFRIRRRNGHGRIRNSRSRNHKRSKNGKFNIGKPIGT